MWRGMRDLYKRVADRCQSPLSHASRASVLVVALAAGGCSMSFPIAGLSSKAEDDLVLTTGSVLPARDTQKAIGLAELAPDLGPEDWRRAEGAMALALDPQGNGAPVSWDNAQSGAKGNFTPVGGPFLRQDEICRAFLASITMQTGPVKLQGTACRPSGGEWAVVEAKPWKNLA